MLTGRVVTVDLDPALNSHGGSLTFQVTSVDYDSAEVGTVEVHGVTSEGGIIVALRRDQFAELVCQDQAPDQDEVGWLVKELVLRGDRGAVLTMVYKMWGAFEATKHDLYGKIGFTSPADQSRDSVLRLLANWSSKG